MTPGTESVAVLVSAVVVVAWIASGWVTIHIARQLGRGLPVVERRPHEPVPWDGVDVIAAVVAMMAAQIVARAAISGMAADAGSIQAALVAGTLAMIGGTGIVVVLLRRLGASWSALGVAPLRPAADLRLAWGGLALVLAPLLGVAALLNQIVPYTHPIIDFLTRHRTPSAVAMVVVSAVVIAPITEEFLFRRVLQGWLEKLEPRLGPGTAIGLSSLAFALAHAGHGLAWVPLLALGGLLGYLVRQTGSIVPAIALHALFNAVSVLLLLLQTSGWVPAG